jgi:integrase
LSSPSPLVKSSQSHLKVNDQEHRRAPAEEKPRIVYRVTTGSLSLDTKVSYQRYINDFLAFYKITDIEIVKDWSPKLARQHLIDYVIHLRDFKRFPRGSINVHVAAVSHFFYMIRDDATRIDMTKVRMELPPDESTHRDRPYTVDEIRKMLSVCHRARDKVIILLLTSTGMRIGAIHSLKMRDLQPKETSAAGSDSGGAAAGGSKVYMVSVYSSFPSDTYVTPCSPECATAIDEYLEERTSRADEVLKADSPLIRNLYDIKKRAVKPLTKPGVLYLVNRIVKESGIKSAFQFKGEAKRALGFRKFYKTQAEESGMKSINVEVAHGHSIGVSGHYYRPKPSVYAKYSNNFDQAASLVNECSGDHESDIICVNNNPQTQGEDNVVNTPIDTTIASGQGPPGPAGPQGPAGPKQVLQVREVESDVVVVSSATTGQATANCDADEVVTGGGARVFENPPPENELNPNNSGFRVDNGWEVEYRNPGPDTIFITAFAECAKLVDAP